MSGETGPSDPPFRPLTPAPEDLAAAAGLHAQGFAPAWSAGSIGDLLAGPGVEGWLIGPRGAETGFALIRAAAGEAEILTICVARPARGRGLGRNIMQILLARLAELAVEAVFLEVAEDNAAAIRLYKGAGFEMVGRRHGYYRENGSRNVDALVLARKRT